MVLYRYIISLKISLNRFTQVKSAHVSNTFRHSVIPKSRLKVSSAVFQNVTGIVIAFIPNILSVAAHWVKNNLIGGYEMPEVTYKWVF